MAAAVAAPGGSPLRRRVRKVHWDPEVVPEDDISSPPPSPSPPAVVAAVAATAGAAAVAAAAAAVAGVGAAPAARSEHGVALQWRDITYRVTKKGKGGGSRVLHSSTSRLNLSRV